jgi:hypothetical protein
MAQAKRIGMPCLALPFGPSHVCEMASPLFCDVLIQNLRLKLFFNVHLLKPGVFGFQLLHPGHHRGIHTAVFSTPFIEGSRADP